MNDKSADIKSEKMPYVQTFKSGRFYFSSDYDESKLSSSIIEAIILEKTISDLPTVLPDIATGFDEEIIRRSITGTAKIEGNPLNEEQVGEILEKKNIAVTNETAKREIQNLRNIYDVIRDFKLDKEPLRINQELIKKIHTLVTFDINYNGNSPGHYRNHEVHVGNTSHGGVYVPPKIIEDIQKLMDYFIEWLNSEEIRKIPPMLRAFLAHYYIALIHPFGDGNGRTARAIEAILLQSSGYKYASILIWEYYYKNVDDYYWAFSNSIKSRNLTLFFEFCLKALILVLHDIKSRISYLINKYVLQDFIDFKRKKKSITLRQHSLLKLLLEHNIEFYPREISEKESLRILYKSVSSRTIMRDLAKLKNMKLLIEENGKYRLNMSYLQNIEQNK